MTDPKHQVPNDVTTRSLAGRRVLVTGANRGIGRAIAESFVAQGARLLVHARADAQTLAAELGASEGVDGDLRDRDLPKRLAYAVARLGGLDLLILNAAVLGPIGPIDTIDPDVFSDVMRVNVDSQLAIFQALVPALLESTPAAVLWLSSGLGRFALPGYGAYCVSKHALEGLSRLAHAEYGARGLTSVTVSPGMVQTEMLKAALQTDDVSQHTSPAVIGEAFARFARVVAPNHSGMALEIRDF